MKFFQQPADLKKLSWGFFFLFFGYNSVQQYLTNYFDQDGLYAVGFKVLILIYLFFTLADPLSAVVVSRFGPKASMIAGTVFYCLFILAVATKLPMVIYPAGVLLGVAAALLWTGQNSYIIRVSDPTAYGRSIGFFGTFMALGPALGIPLFGFLISKVSFNIPLLIFAVFPLIGLLYLFQLKNVAVEPVSDHWRLLRKTFTSKMILRLAFIWLASFFAFGLAIGLIPISIGRSLGLGFVGPLTLIFYLLPIILSYFLGSISDKYNRLALMAGLLLLGSLGLLLLFFANSPPLFFIGVLLLAASSSSPVAGALVGDVSNNRNLAFLTAVLWTAENIGIVSALVLSSFVQSRNTYLLSMMVLLSAAGVAYLLSKTRIEKIKEVLSRETT